VRQLIPIIAAIVGAAFASLIRTVGADVSDFVAIEASLWSLFARFSAVAAQVGVRAAVIARLSAGSLLSRFSAVATQVAFRAAIIALSRTEAALLIAFATYVSTAATVVAVLVASTSATAK